MTTQEFSNEFDTLVYNYTPSNFGELNRLLFDEYEKSVFLTRAQTSLVLDFYTGKGTTYNSFEDTEESRRYLSSLIKTVSISPLDNGEAGISDNSYFFNLPEDTLFIVYESVNIENSEGNKTIKNVKVVPLLLDNTHNTLKNPFRKPSKERAYRLDIEDNRIEIISDLEVKEYLVRYIRIPDPIILLSLPDGLSINNSSEETECKLNPILHKTILDEAVRMALSSRNIVIK